MGSLVTVAVATADKRLMARIESLTRGSHIAVIGATPFSDKAIQLIAARRLHILVLDGDSAEQEYLLFVRKIRTISPATKCVIFGNSVNVAVIARAVAAGVQAQLPTTINYPDFVESLTRIAAGESPKADSAFTRIAESMAIPASEGRADNSSGTITSAMRTAASHCLTLGLTVPETALYLSTSEEQIEKCLARTTTAGSTPGLITKRRLLYGAALAFALLTMQRVSGMRAPDIPNTKPVHGQVLYEDGSALPAEICELLFHPLDTPARGRSRVGRAVVTGQQGEIKRVCYDAQYPGLPPRKYNVTISLPGQMALPLFIAGEEYGNPATTPLRVDTSREPVVLRIRKPKELMERFDSDANGALEAVERTSARDAINEYIASRGRGD